MRQKLGYLGDPLADVSERSLVRDLLTCAYQSTRNSSEITRKAAAEVATALGATYYELDVDSLVQDYVEMVSQAIGRPLSWQQDDLTLQNIQALRTRPERLDAGELARCCSPPAIARKRPSAMPRWTATPAAGCRRSPASTRPSCDNGCDGWRRPARSTAPAVGSELRQSAGANGRTSAAGERPDGRSRSDALRCARCDRTGGDSRQANAARALQHLQTCFRITRPSNLASGSSGSFYSGVVTNGSENGTPRPSTSTTRTWIPRPGAGFRSRRVVTNGSYRNYATTLSSFARPPTNLKRPC